MFTIQLNLRGFSLTTVATLLFALATTASADDCNTNGLDDACDISCGTAGDPCDLPGCGLSEDCNTNGIPDECDLVSEPQDYHFPTTLFENSTGYADSYFVGPPDDVYRGLGGQIVTYDFSRMYIRDEDGPDFTVYEVDSGGAEFPSIDVLVSMNGLDFVSVKSTETDAVYIPGDEAHTIAGFAYSYDLAPSNRMAARYVRIDGVGDSASGASNYFDLDAMGAVNLFGFDCDGNGAIDTCEIELGLTDDCNNNGLIDECEVTLGAVYDCNSNNIPDECDTAANPTLDCNNNSIIDDCEVAWKFVPDCNSNGVPDECDAAGATSPDCNNNLIPDECEIDCNINGVPDDCDIADSTSTDCNTNAIPDECDMATPTFLGDSGPLSPFGSNQQQSYTLATAFPANGPVTITVYGYGDFSATNEYVTIVIDGQEIGQLFVNNGVDCTICSDQLVITAETFNDFLFNSGGMTIDVVPSIYVGSTGCPEDMYIRVTVEYEKLLDCNQNQQFDFCDILNLTSDDDNLNNIPDECEDDCNSNLSPDDWDIYFGTSSDCNHNGYPDECDVAYGTSGDCNNDNIPDECPICPVVELFFIMDHSYSMDDEAAVLCSIITDVTDQLQADLVDIDAHLLALWSLPGGSYSCLEDTVRHLYGTDVPGDPPINNEIFGACPNNSSEVASEDWARGTSMVAGRHTWQAGSVRVIVPMSDEGPWCGDPSTNPGVDADSITHAIWVAQQNNVIVSPIACSGSSAAMISLAQQLADETGGILFSSSLPAEDLAEGIKSIVISACTTAFDCNTNSVPDDCDIAAGTSSDCDKNGVPDECDPDCNTNGIADTCDVLYGGAPDCNDNLIPDECETDCNDNDVPDDCDIEDQTSLDCNLNTIPDECDLAQGTSDDCNLNAIPDECDIESQTSDDCNYNLRPDECDMNETTFTDSSDLYGPVGSGYTNTWYLPAPLVSAGDVTFTLIAFADLEAADEYLALDINGTNIGNAFTDDGQHCAETTTHLTISAETFNNAVAGSDAYIAVTAPATVNPSDCSGVNYLQLLVEYEPLPDCNENGTLDPCDIADGFSFDVDINGQPDECQPDCNTNAIPDKYETIQGLAPDCNNNFVPDECDVAEGTSHDCNTSGIPDECETDCNHNGWFDECDVAAGTSLDCNYNIIPDECEIDCNSNAVPDDCDITYGTSIDCNTNAIPDECDVLFGADKCRFPTRLSENTTGYDDSYFTGPPDDSFVGIGGQIVTYEFDCGLVYDDPGLDITVYEVDYGGAEFGSMDILVSLNGTDFFSIKTSESAAVEIPGDEVHGNTGFARSYDLAASGLAAAHYIRIDGSGTGSSGATTGFDLDAIGIIGTISVDCNANNIPDSCDIESAFSEDCNTNGVPDECGDIPAGDCNCDNVVDLNDYDLLEPCLISSGPYTPLEPTDCNCFDFDIDNDVDLKDFAYFQELITP